jgi:hypothetical protein
MIIILEGPDGAGKSVLATTLQHRLSAQGQKVTLRHHGPYPTVKDPSINYLGGLKRFGHSDNARQALVIDRCWLSEPIYGAALRKGVDRVGVASRRMLERVALKIGTIVVRCRPPFEVCQRNWAARKGIELIQDNEVLQQVHALYGAMHEHTHLPVIDYDYTGARDALDPLWQMIDALRHYRPPSVGIGAWSSKSMLLVGERVSRYGISDDLPFMSFHRGGCSQWLALQLEAWGVREDRLYWVNAATASPDFLGRVDAPPRAIALGQAAARWCRHAGLNYVTVPHPQHQKRFHHNEPYLSLKEALT